jgi:hypothetical protein
MALICSSLWYKSLLSYKRWGKTRYFQELLDRVPWRLSLNHSGGLDWLEEYRLVKK